MISRVRNFHFLISHPASRAMGTGGTLSSVVKQEERESDHTPTTSAEFKKTWIYTSNPRYALME
jgi:hypothetical protein